MGASGQTNENANAKERRAIGVGVLMFIGGVLSAVVFAIFVPGSAVGGDWMLVVTLGLALAAAGVVALAFILRGHSKFWSNLLFAGAMVALGAGGVSYAVLHSLNRLLDSAPARDLPGTVLSSKSGSKGGGTSIVELAGGEGQVTIPKMHQKGTPIIVHMKPGRFGWRWIEQAQPAGSPR